MPDLCVTPLFDPVAPSRRSSTWVCFLHVGKLILIFIWLQNHAVYLPQTVFLPLTYRTSNSGHMSCHVDLGTEKNPVLVLPPPQPSSILPLFPQPLDTQHHPPPFPPAFCLFTTILLEPCLRRPSRLRLFRGVSPPFTLALTINAAEVTPLLVPPLAPLASSLTTLSFLPFAGGFTTDVSSCFRGLFSLEKPKPHPAVEHCFHLSHTNPMPINTTMTTPLPPIPNSEGTHTMSVLTPSKNVESATTPLDHLYLCNNSFTAYTSTVEDWKRAYGSKDLLALRLFALIATTTLSLPSSPPLHLATRGNLATIRSSALESSNLMGSPPAARPTKVSLE